jgi:hypothetical protein
MRRIAGLMILAGVFVVAGCGGSSQAPTSTSSETTAAEQAVAHIHQLGGILEACEGERKANLAWAEAMQNVVHDYGEAGMYRALPQADKDSYKVEEASKKLEAAIPSATEAIARYSAVVGTVRRAVGEGLGQVTAALSEGTAASQGITSACESASKSSGG